MMGSRFLRAAGVAGKLLKNSPAAPSNSELLKPFCCGGNRRRIFSSRSEAPGGRPALHQHPRQCSGLVRPGDGGLAKVTEQRRQVKWPKGNKKFTSLKRASCNTKELNKCALM